MAEHLSLKADLYERSYKDLARTVPEERWRALVEGAQYELDRPIDDYLQGPLVPVVQGQRQISSPAAAGAVFAACFLISFPLSIVQKVQTGLQQGFTVSLWQSGGNLLGLAAVLAVLGGLRELLGRGTLLSGLELVLGSLTDVPRLDRFQLYSLSNIFDWADDRLPTEWGQLLASVAAPGSAVLIRQLNNRRDVRRFFAPAFHFDEALGAALQASDRSLFYERIEVGFRR